MRYLNSSFQPILMNYNASMFAPRDTERAVTLSVPVDKATKSKLFVKENTRGQYNMVKMIARY